MLTMKQNKKTVNHCKKTFKEVATQSYIGVLNLFSLSLKDISEKHHFSNLADYMTAALLKK